MTVDSPPSITAMHELVVPRSMPITLPIWWNSFCVAGFGIRKSQSVYSRFIGGVPGELTIAVGIPRLSRYECTILSPRTTRSPAAQRRFLGPRARLPRDRVPARAERGRFRSARGHGVPRAAPAGARRSAGEPLGGRRPTPPAGLHPDGARPRRAGAEASRMVRVRRRCPGGDWVIERWLAELERDLRVHGRRRRRIVEELADHLRESAASHGEQIAVARMGDPGEVARSFTPRLIDRAFEQRDRLASLTMLAAMVASL